LDVHVYPEATGPQSAFLASDLQSVEWSVVQGNLPKMAVIMGEFGTYEGTFKDVDLAGTRFFIFMLFPVVITIFLFSCEEHGNSSKCSCSYRLAHTLILSAMSCYHLQVRSCGYGFSGWLYWTWDCEECPGMSSRALELHSIP
jgi:hypothetical protein